MTRKEGLPARTHRSTGKEALSGRTRGEAGFGGPWRVVLSAATIFLVSQFIAAFIIGVIIALKNPSRHAVDIFSGSILEQFFYVLMAEALAVWMVWWLLKRRKLKLSAIGLGRYPRWNDLKYALGGAALFYLLAIIGSIILSLFVSQTELNKQQDIGFNSISTNLDWVLAFMSLVILPPIAEEILMRGYLYSGLRKSLKFWPALLLTSFLFGLAHLNGGADGSVVWAAASDTFILSAVLVYIRESSGALYAGMLIHATNNLVAFGVHFK